MSNKIDHNLSKRRLYSLEKRYSWLKVFSRAIENYIHPNYYKKLLKEYIFDGKSDLDYFRDHLRSLRDVNLGRILELGCGSGRATDILLKEVSFFKELDLVDLSRDMIFFIRKKYKDYRDINFYGADILNYLEKTQFSYSFVFSLWSFSHSIHQHMVDDGIRLASKYTETVIKKFIKSNMVSGAEFFLIHFDTLSQEQRILMKQWKKYFSVFADDKHQSPFKLLLDRTLKSLEGKVIKDLFIKHYIGDSIKYKSLNEALEIFMNFHMETEFNRSKNVEEIIEELRRDFKPYKKNNSYYIRPGCFIYSFIKK